MPFISSSYPTDTKSLIHYFTHPNPSKNAKNPSTNLNSTSQPFSHTFSNNHHKSSGKSSSLIHTKHPTPISTHLSSKTSSPPPSTVNSLSTRLSKSSNPNKNERSSSIKKSHCPLINLNAGPWALTMVGLSTKLEIEKFSKEVDTKWLIWTCQILIFSMKRSTKKISLCIEN